jgi:uncharacterized protein (DUF362 family)/NAD-dependent dihydropyrimidine dehydrogenase PreA subunit
VAASDLGEARVSLVTCDTYEPHAVEAAVARAFDLVGGAQAVARAGDSVFVKTNCVIAAEPDSGIVSNPAVVKAVVEQLQRVTERVTIGDSPGGPFNQTLLKRVYEKTGMARVARETGAELAFDTRTVEVQFPEGRSIKRLALCASMVEADRLVSVSKFKSHRYLNVTGPIKNMYGAVPGTTKFVYHSRFDDAREFANLIVDVHMACRPAFNVLDAVEAIEGEGARHGTRKKLGAIAAGTNAFALECLVMEIAGLAPADNRVLQAAIDRGLCPGGVDWLDIMGDSIDGLRVSDFKLPSVNFFSERVPARISERLSRFVSVTPKPVAGACTLCGKCAEVCPRGAITMGKDAAEVDLSKCIRCFCCDELCEHQAVGIRKPLLMRLFK